LQYQTALFMMTILNLSTEVIMFKIRISAFLFALFLMFSSGLATAAIPMNLRFAILAAQQAAPGQPTIDAIANLNTILVADVKTGTSAAAVQDMISAAITGVPTSATTFISSTITAVPNYASSLTSAAVAAVVTAVNTTAAVDAVTTAAVTTAVTVESAATGATTSSKSAAAAVVGNAALNAAGAGTYSATIIAAVNTAAAAVLQPPPFPGTSVLTPITIS
jgi:hypothetical protein